MGEFKDYYKILGVSLQSTKEDIKKAYRTLAKKYHPDIYKGDDAEEKFKDINEAYNTLYDDAKREQYNQASGFASNPFDQGYSDQKYSRKQNKWQDTFNNNNVDDFDNPFLKDEPNPFASNESSPFQSGDSESPFFKNNFNKNVYDNEVFVPKFNPFKNFEVKKEEKVDLHKAYTFNPFSDASTINKTLNEENSSFSYHQDMQSSLNYINAQLNKSYETYDPNKYEETNNFLNINKLLEVAKDAKKNYKKIETNALKIHKNLENFIFVVNNGKKTFELKYGNRNFENIVILTTSTDFEIIGQNYSRICLAAGGLSAKDNNENFGSFAQCYGDEKTLIIIPNSVLVSKINIGLPFGFRYKNLCFISKRGSLTIYSSDRNADLKFKKILISSESGNTQIKLASSFLSIDSQKGNIRAIISHLNENSALSITSGEGYIDLEPHFQINTTKIFSSKGCLTNIHDNSKYNYYMELDISTNKSNVNIR